MLEGKALTAVRGYKFLPSEDALPKVIQTLEIIFGNPQKIMNLQRDKLLHTKLLRDNVHSLSDFLADLNIFFLLRMNI